MRTSSVKLCPIKAFFFRVQMFVEAIPSSDRRAVHKKMIFAPHHRVSMSVRIEDNDCQFCGKKAKQFCFAAFVCESPECVDKARDERGGPGGHMKNKAHPEPIVFDDEK
jgi:hypothetical protein